MMRFSLLLFVIFIHFSLSYLTTFQSSPNLLNKNKKSCIYASIMLSDSMESKTFPEISLPYLTPRDKMSLASGERVQRQDRNGCRGSGLVVVDIPSSADLVFDTLTRFGRYQDMIPTVRSSKILANDGINTVAEFTLSRFLLRVNVNHKVLKEQKIIRFNLDQSRPNLVFREAEGFWHVQEPSDRPKGYCRVYLSANILAHPMVPPLLLDYAATRALPRATKWLKPYFLENPSYTEHF